VIVVDTIQKKEMKEIGQGRMTYKGRAGEIDKKKKQNSKH